MDSHSIICGLSYFDKKSRGHLSTDSLYVWLLVSLDHIRNKPLDCILLQASKVVMQIYREINKSQIIMASSALTVRYCSCTTNRLQPWYGLFLPLTHKKHTRWAKLGCDWNKGLETMQGEKGCGDIGEKEDQFYETRACIATFARICDQFAWCKHTRVDLLLVGSFIEPDRLTSLALFRLQRINRGVCSVLVAEAEHISVPFIRIQTYISTEGALLGCPSLHTLLKLYSQVMVNLIQEAKGGCHL